MRELSLHVLDVLENSVEAGATRIEILIDEDLEADRMVIEVADNGRGMSKELASTVLNPFVTTRTTRHVGLGLPLFAAAARQCGGSLTIDSQSGKGTKVLAEFRHSHVDRAPLGDVPAVLMAILLSGRRVDIVYTHKTGTLEFRLDTSKIRKELGDVPLTHPKVRSWLMEVLLEGEADLRTKQSNPHLVT